MAISSSVTLSNKSQEKLIKYYQSLQNNCNVTREAHRSNLERIDLQYQRELDNTEEARKAKQANRAGDVTKHRNVTVPVIMPQVEAAVVYQTSVFLTGEPLFGVVAPPEYIDEALQLESVIEEQSLRGGWTREFMLAFRDGFKYNECLIEVNWETEAVNTVETSLEDTDGTNASTKETLWSGNKIKRWDLYNSFYDNRVDITELATKGEFAGTTQFMSKIAAKAYVNSLVDPITANIRPAFESASTVSIASNIGSYNFYVPNINSKFDLNRVSEVGDTDWHSWAGIESSNKGNGSIQYKVGYEITKLYIRILPSDFNIILPKSNTPQIFKLIIVNHSVIVKCELQTNAHNLIPVFGCRPKDDGLGVQTKSLAENAEDFQQLATSYMTSIIASQRRAINDRLLFDPSRVNAKDINSPNPAAKIPVRPSAYGEDLGKAVYQFPYRNDNTATDMQQIQTLMGLANTVNGQNQARQGQFVKGNKTLREYESVMQNANGSDQMTSILLEAQLFTPLKRVLKINILQYQGQEAVYSRTREKLVNVDPIKLRNAVLNFRVTDGLTPSSKVINSENFSVALQTIATSPQIGGGYNVTKLFSYLMKTQGADLRPFEKSDEQLAYEQAMSAWQQQAQLALEKGAEFNTPQPKPQDYGYNPNPNNPQQQQEQQQLPQGNNTDEQQ